MKKQSAEQELQAVWLVKQTMWPVKAVPHGGQWQKQQAPFSLSPQNDHQLTKVTYKKITYSETIGSTCSMLIKMLMYLTQDTSWRVGAK